MSIFYALFFKVLVFSELTEGRRFYAERKSVCLVMEKADYAIGGVIYAG